jgi:hypothetical protein
VLRIVAPLAGLWTPFAACGMASFLALRRAHAVGRTTGPARLLENSAILSGGWRCVLWLGIVALASGCRPRPNVR